MRVLVLGGTWFLGRAVVVEALRRGHEVTTFNRGRTDGDVPGAEVVRGDRESHADLERLVAGRSWDAVLDTSGYAPRFVGLSARVLADHVDRYLFCSTLDAYADWPHRAVTETSPLHPCPVDAGPGDARYGILKAGCEHALREMLPERSLSLRLGVILGPREPKGRLLWWLRRIEAGGTVLAPGAPDRAMQVIDVRDAAAFALDAAARWVPGTVNVSGRTGNTTFGSWLTDCRAVVGSDAEFEWVEDRFLIGAGVKDWTTLPLWRPALGTWALDVERARAQGLHTRPVAETVRDTWQWLNSGGSVAAPRRTAEHGLSHERERELLKAWQGRAARDD